MREKSFATRDGELRYWIGGPSGDAGGAAYVRPWLIFLPGLTADHHLFDRQVEYFEGQGSCLVWDPPAHGASRPFPLDFSMDDMAIMLHGIFEKEGISQPVLIGQSMGGYVSQAYLDLYPGTVRGFVSIDSAPLKRRYMRSWEIWSLKHTKAMFSAIPWEKLIETVAKGTSESEYGRSLMECIIRSYDKAEYCALSAYGYRLLAKAIEADRPYEIGCPVILICGEHDAAGYTKEYNERWAALEGLEIAWAKGAGHNSNTDAPEFVNSVIEEFLQKLG